MKRISLLTLAFHFTVTLSATAQQPDASEACKFKVSESTTKPAITGPDEIVKLVHIMEQPDSPLEVVALDFTPDGYLSISNEQYASQLRCTVRVRNRSDRTIQRASINVGIRHANGGTGSGGQVEALVPGQEVEVRACGGRGSGGAKNNHVRILGGVRRVDFGTCMFVASSRIPKELGVKGISFP